jgi:hypothetical protein
MPKKMNISKNASALLQNEKQIMRALKGLLEPTNFAYVENAKSGDGQFTLKLTENKTGRGTPRGLFTCGSMRIVPGQIVIVEGDLKNGFEIVGCMEREDDEVTELIKSGFLPADILPSAEAGVSGAAAAEDLFDRSAEDEAAIDVRDVDSARSNKAMRKQQEQRAAVKARLGMLKSGRGSAAAGSGDLDVDSI